MDFGMALSLLIKQQQQYPDPATILALANMKYPLQNYGIPNYQPLLQTRQHPLQQQQGGMQNLDIASLLAAAAASASEADNKHLVASLASVLAHTQPQTTTPSSTPNNLVQSLVQLPMPIPAQPTSPTQSSASASSISSSSSLLQSAQNSPVPNRSNGTTTPVFSGYKRKLNGTPARKPPAPIPDEKKDEAYYERRKKNNDAAKRSRDSRRMKEEQTASKAGFLEQENMQLRAQVEMLKNEVAKLQMWVISKTPNPFLSLGVKEELSDSSTSASDDVHHMDEAQGPA